MYTIEEISPSYLPSWFKNPVRRIILTICLKLKYFFKYGTFDFFNYVDIEINTSCNLRCSYCPNSVYNKGLIKNEKLMSIELYKKIIDGLAESNFTGLIDPVLYGEPLMREDLADLMKYAHEKLPKATLRIVSNGNLLTIDKYVELVKAGVKIFLITQHESKATENLKKLNDYLNKNPQVKKVSIIALKFDEKTPLFNRGGEVKPETTNYYPRCREPDNALVIDYAGNVGLCCNDYFSTIKFGNINNQKLVDIWNSQKYKDIRKQLKNRIYNLNICRKCLGLNV